MSRKELEKELRREFIVNAAEKLFRIEGFENTLMDEIAKEAEFSKTTLYKYFKSKDELALSVYQRLHLKKMKILKRAMEAYPDPIDKLYAFGQAYLSFFMEHPDYLRFQTYWDYRGLDKQNIRPGLIGDFEESLSDDVNYFVDVFKQGIDKGSLRSDLDISKTLDLFYLILRTVMNQIVLINPKITFGSIINPDEGDYALVLSMFINSLRP